MQPQKAKIIKSSRFEDGTFQIRPAEALGRYAEELGPSAVEHHVDTAALVKAAQEEAAFAKRLAENEIEELKQRAALEIEALKARALEEARREGFAQGQKEGQQAGQQAVLDQHAQLIAALGQATDDADRARRAFFEGHQRDLVRLSLLIAQKILLMELKTSRESVLRLAEAALKRLTEKSNVRLRVHPDDLGTLRAAKAKLLLSVDNLPGIEIVGDERVGAGGCMVETGTGVVDARLAVQLGQVAAALLEQPLGEETADPLLRDAIQALESSRPELAAPLPAAEVPAPAPRPVAPPAPILQAPSAPFPAPSAPIVPVASPSPVVTPEPVVEAAPMPAPVIAEPTPPAAAAPMPAVPEPAPAPTPVESNADYEAYDEPAWDELVAYATATMAPEAGSTPPPRPNFDPSKRAAEALAWRLGQLKRGRAIATVGEEYAMKMLEGALSDSELETIVRQVIPRAAGMDIPSDEPLVHVQPSIDLAADALAERLGKKKKATRPWYEGLEPGAEPADPAAPSVDMAAEALAERLGKKKPGRPTEAQLRELGSALGDEVIDNIVEHLIPHAPAEPEPEAPADLDKASDNLMKLLGQRKKGNRPWYTDLE
ncbi:MAG TPA: FliH/SctL family protein [Oscillatoriaceae cyanobacterium]